MNYRKRCNNNNINLCNALNQLLLQLSLSKLYSMTCMRSHTVLSSSICTVFLSVHLCVLSNRPPYHATLHMVVLNGLGLLSNKVTQRNKPCLQEGSVTSLSRQFYSFSWICTHHIWTSTAVEEQHVQAVNTV